MKEDDRIYSCIQSGAIHGVEGRLISVEADVSDGLPVFSLVGLLSSEVREAEERVKNALRNSGFHMQAKHVTINLSPADVRKAGSGFDLPIAIAILCAYAYIPANACDEFLILGELGLDGAIKPVKGVLPIVDEAKNAGLHKCIVPYDNISEAKLVDGMQVYGSTTLYEVIQFFLCRQPLYTECEKGFSDQSGGQLLDMADIRGQMTLKRAVTISAAGMHNILIGGPPGAGKSMIAKRLPSILPELTYSESMELTKIYSAAGLMDSRSGLMKRRPFRMPHHTISDHALIGGGRTPKPGEISLAHCGVLFLDEFPEFPKRVIEVLRQPIENRVVTIARVDATYTFPADFVLVAAMNLCPCGNYPDMNRCICTEYDRKRYLRRMSQPLLDRIDIQIFAQQVSYDDLHSNAAVQTSADIRADVERVHLLQHKRYAQEDILFNSQLAGSLLDKYCGLSAECCTLLKDAHDKLRLSARAHTRIKRVARTIADLEGAKKIGRQHLMEAISYREMEEMSR